MQILLHIHSIQLKAFNIMNKPSKQNQKGGTKPKQKVHT